LSKFIKHNIISLILFLVLVIIGIQFGVKDHIKWERDVLVWGDFQETDSLDGGFAADILSDIKIKGNFKDIDFEVYAYMNPNNSNRIKDSLTDQTLIHESYHFNITEYHARLFRKEIVSIGINSLTEEKIASLYNHYITLCNKMQDNYDTETDHNLKYEDQRYWEMKIDDFLRQTEIYRKTKLESYSDFKVDETEYYKHVLLNIENQFLTSYPVNKTMVNFGHVYKVSKYKDSVILKHFQNGNLTNGGDFDTAILKLIHKSKDTVEKHFLNPDKTYNLELPYQKLTRIENEDKGFVIQYFNERNNRITYRNSYQKKFKRLPDNKLVATFYDRNENNIVQSDGVYSVRRTLDSLGRVLLIETLGKDSLYCVDKSDLSSAIRYTYNLHHKLKQKTYFNLYGKYAKHINQYNTSYKYDDLGNIKELIVLNDKNKKTEDKEGISIYKYSYDLLDNVIQTKRYNSKIYPVLGREDFFKSVADYDDQNRIYFEGKYYFLNRLKFNNDDKWGASKYEYLGDSIRLMYNLDVYNDHSNDDTGVATVKNFINKRGLVERTQFLDSKGNFAKVKDKVVQYKYAYDANGNTIEETTLDSLGVRIHFSEDVATFKWTFNSDNVKTKTTYFTKEGELADAKQGATYNIYVLNDKNEIIEVKNCDKQMNPIEIDGVYKTTYVLNRFNKDSIVSYYNKNDNLIKGVAIIKYKYNFYSSLIEESYFNSRKKRIKDSEGVSFMRYLIDDRQQNIGYKYYDTNFRRTNNKIGYHHEKITLDNYGYVIEEQYFDKRKKPVLNSEKYHRAIYQRDSLGEIVNYKQYNTYNKLTDDKYGIAEIKYERAKIGLIKSIKNYNSKGDLSNDEDGVAETYYSQYLNGLYFLDKELDENGNKVKTDD
jgi:YD repeat-containing protein